MTFTYKPWFFNMQDIYMCNVDLTLLITLLKTVDRVKVNLAVRLFAVIYVNVIRTNKRYTTLRGDNNQMPGY